MQNSISYEQNNLPTNKIYYETKLIMMFLFQIKKGFSYFFVSLGEKEDSHEAFRR